MLEIDIKRPHDIFFYRLNLYVLYKNIQTFKKYKIMDTKKQLYAMFKNKMGNCEFLHKLFAFLPIYLQ